MRDLIESIEELTEAFAETINVTGGDKLEMTRKSFRLLDQMMSTMRIGRSERKEYMNGSMPIPQSWVARLVREGGAKKVKKRAPSSKKAENSLPSAREAEKAIQGVYRKIEKDLEGGWEDILFQHWPPERSGGGHTLTGLLSDAASDMAASYKNEVVKVGKKGDFNVQSLAEIAFGRRHDVRGAMADSAYEGLTKGFSKQAAMKLLKKHKMEVTKEQEGFLR